jgi:hypothetical protein
MSYLCKKTIHLKNSILLIISLVFASLVNAQEIKAELYITTSYTVAIFPDSFPMKDYKQRFTPTRPDTDKAEKALSRDLFMLNQEMENQNRDNLIHRRLLQFNRQYFGFINDKGERVIKIIAYIKSDSYRIDDDSDLLTKERIIVAGTCDNWVVFYNIDTNELYDLAVGRPISNNSERTVKEIKSADAVKLKLDIKKIDSTNVESREVGDEEVLD